VAEAQRRRIPTVIHEANSLPGITNRLLARRASAVCVGAEDAAARFGRRPTTFTGNPVHPDLAPLSRAEGLRRLGLAPAAGRTLLVTGGSLGSRGLNDWVLAARRRLGGGGVRVIWQSGRAHHAACRAALDPAAPVHLVPYLEDMAAAYAAADLVVAAAGALTIAELGVLGRPAILLPAPGVAEDHQRHNVLALERRGLEIALTTGSLLERVLGLIHDEAGLAALGERARRLAVPDAADRIAACVLAVTGRAPGPAESRAWE
jgi:UDP-N-acetylglucosamine--N-acetylmuramyl-(pentapeptide) pyrophosphoryl-undecaprenol N-acetylglucosamine transferase